MTALSAPRLTPVFYGIDLQGPPSSSALAISTSSTRTVITSTPAGSTPAARRMPTRRSWMPCRRSAMKLAWPHSAATSLRCGRPTARQVEETSSSRMPVGCTGGLRLRAPEFDYSSHYTALSVFHRIASLSLGRRRKLPCASEGTTHKVRQARRRWHGLSHFVDTFVQ
jgi:hypothetical protein